jgi:hypothetical protein
MLTMLEKSILPPLGFDPQSKLTGITFSLIHVLIEFKQCA